MTSQPDNDTASNAGTGSLINTALAQVAGLFRNEIDLARAETEQTLRRAAAGIALIVTGALIALAALNVLAAALVDAIAELGLEPAWAALIVGISLAATALGLTLAGAKALNPSNLKPTRALKQHHEDRQALKEALK
ncbi:phage holin family protein [Meridianimarinicoccus aquatilis]|uniref:Phage holin family protein n=1 Tax=Meridianimarinicoccus aquatilis TaxID=2552766 RepID=A0A4R6ATR4_9RHOB|nr:phage holin family protein [Fluviibacterium aquatile]TDL87075.1 phage holin family protein [Fluviibacterium aquatile]